MVFYITITLRHDNCVQISIFVYYAQGKTADPGRCLEKQRTTIERQIEEEEQLLLELEVNLDPMNINVRTLACHWKQQTHVWKLSPSWAPQPS